MAHPDTQERPDQKEHITFVRAQLHFTHFVQFFVQFHAVPPKFEAEQ